MTDTIMPETIKEMLAWQDAHLGDLEYSQGSTRLSADLLDPTDCSGLIAKLMRQFARIYVGTYTGNECNYGTLITVSRGAARDGYGMLPGDVILYNWDYEPDGPWNHINMYAGDGVVFNHGGPGRGPVRQSLASNVDDARHVMVRRFIAWPVRHQHAIYPPIVTAKSGANNPLHGQPIPSLIARGTGDYYGDIKGPNASHGGFTPDERPAIKLLQRFLNWKMSPHPPVEVDGTFGPKMTMLVTRFQHEHPHLPHINDGQVWYEDWHNMASM